MRRLVIILSFFLVLGNFSSFAFSSERDDFREAESRFFHKDYALSLELYNRFLKQYTISKYTPVVFFHKAICFYQLKRYKEALELFNKLEERYASSSYSSQIPFWKGITFYALHEYEKAVNTLDSFLKEKKLPAELTGTESLEKDSEDLKRTAIRDLSLIKQALLYKGMSEAHLAYNSQALDTLHKLFALEEKKSAQPHALVLYFSLALKEKQFLKVKELFDTLQLDDFQKAWRDRIVLYGAESYWQTGSTDKAELFYNQLIDSELEVASIAYQRLFLLAQQKQDDEKMRQIVVNAEKNLKTEPTLLIKFWLRIGIANYKKAKDDLALSYFQKIWDLKELEQIESTVPIYMANLYEKSDNRTKAIQILDEYLKINKKDSERPLLLLHLGNLYLEEKQWPEAENALAQAMNQAGNNTYKDAAAYFYAFALYKENKYKEALASLNVSLGAGVTGQFHSPLLRLKANLLYKKGDQAEAIETLKNFISLNPQNIDARLEMIKLLFLQKDYGSVVLRISQLDKDLPQFFLNNPDDYTLTRYYLGLSLISQKEYDQALGSLKTINLQNKALMNNPELSVIYPYALFYRGWAYYKLSNFQDAIKDFSTLIENTPKHELVAQALYLAGWCAYNDDQYKEAEQYFIKLTQRKLEPKFADRALFLLGKSLASQKAHTKALVIYKKIVADNPKSEYADDALFEQANLLAETGQSEEAINKYRDLYAQYPDSYLTEEAMYKRGELNYQVGLFNKAFEAFNEYRIHFPDGKLFDAALYWGGSASVKLKEDFSAILLWEKLVNQYRNSPFRPDAIRQTAEIYARIGDYRKALNLYTELIALYPDEAKANLAEKRSEELRYLLLGLSKQEAELSVVIAREGVKTVKGREAMLALSKIYIASGGEKLNVAFPILEDLLAQSNLEASLKAQTLYLKGEYYYQKNDHARAGNEFLKAATIQTDDKDFMARSMYRAAEMVKLAGNHKEAEEMVKRIEKYFPSSEWANEGRKLIGGK
jgi:TolA-binding protein